MPSAQRQIHELSAVSGDGVIASLSYGAVTNRSGYRMRRWSQAHMAHRKVKLLYWPGWGDISQISYSRVRWRLLHIQIFQTARCPSAIAKQGRPLACSRYTIRPNRAANFMGAQFWTLKIPYRPKSGTSKGTRDAKCVSEILRGGHTNKEVGGKV